MPPHRQAANYYRNVADGLNGEFKVTMEHPKVSKPEPLIITIDKAGGTVKKAFVGGANIVVNKPLRAG